MKRHSFSNGILILALATASLQAQEGQQDKKSESADAPAAKTHKVQLGPFKVSLDLTGVFEAVETAEIVATPKVFSVLTVKRAVAHGTVVKKGDPLVWLDTDKIDEEIKTAVRDVRLGELSLEQAKADFALAKESTPLDLKIAKQTQEAADDELKFYQKHGKQQSIDGAKQSLESARFQLEYAQEELDQLEKMYKADDLTEETEEIILKRARRSVESSQRFLKNAEIGTARRLSTLIPRAEVSLVQAATRAELSYGNAKTKLKTTLQKKQIELAKAIQEQEKLQEKLAELREDRGRMTIRAPQGGYVYYGRCLRGKWLDKAKVDGQLQSGGTLTPKQVVMTVVAARPLQVRADLAEKELYRVKKNTAARIAATGFPHHAIWGKVSHISLIPIADGVFDCRISLAGKDIPDQVVPGMACSVKLRILDKKEAIVIPAAAVNTGQDGSAFVQVIGSDGKPQKRLIETGFKQDTRIEVVVGLKAGEEVLLRKPEGE